MERLESLKKKVLSADRKPIDLFTLFNSIKPGEARIVMLWHGGYPLVKDFAKLWNNYFNRNRVTVTSAGMKNSATIKKEHFAEPLPYKWAFSLRLKNRNRRCEYDSGYGFFQFAHEIARLRGIGFKIGQIILNDELAQELADVFNFLGEIKAWKSNEEKGVVELEKEWKEIL